MARVSLFHVLEGDVLIDDVVIKDALIFGAGTVLTGERIGLLKELKVTTVDIESHQPEILSVPDLIENIDKRFEYVQNSMVMKKLQSWILEKIAKDRAEDETSD